MKRFFIAMSPSSPDSTSPPAEPDWFRPLRLVADDELRKAVTGLFERADAVAQDRRRKGSKVAVVLVSRRLTCLYEMLRAQGMVAFAGCEVMSDRALEGNAHLAGRHAVLIDDAVVLGSTLVDRYDSLSEEHACTGVTTLVACVDRDRSNSNLLAHVGISQHGPLAPVFAESSRIQRFARDLARCLYQAGTPYFTDFPLVRLPLVNGREPRTSPRWMVADVTSPMIAGPGQRSLSMVPTGETLARLRSSGNPEALASLGLAKVRLYIDEGVTVPTSAAELRIVPIGIPNPLMPKRLDRVLESIEELLTKGEQRLVWRSWSIKAKHRILQMYLSTCVLAEVWDDLEGGSGPLTSEHLDAGQKALYFGADDPLITDLFERTIDSFHRSMSQSPRPVEVALPPRSGLGVQAAVRRSIIESRAMAEAAPRVADDLDILAHAIEPARPEEGQTAVVDPVWTHRILSVFGAIDADLERPQQQLLHDVTYAWYRKCRTAKKPVDGLWPRILGMGISLDELNDLLRPEADPSDPWSRAVLSLAVDIGNDLGVIVPATLQADRGPVVRQYRSGETAFLADMPHQALAARPIHSEPGGLDAYTTCVLEHLGVAEADFQKENAVLAEEALGRGRVRQAWSGRVLDVSATTFSGAVTSELEDGQNDVVVLERSLLISDEVTHLEPGARFTWTVTERKSPSGRPWAGAVAFLTAPAVQAPDPFSDVPDVSTAS